MNKLTTVQYNAVNNAIFTLRDCAKYVPFCDSCPVSKSKIEEIIRDLENIRQ